MALGATHGKARCVRLQLSVSAADPRALIFGQRPAGFGLGHGRVDGIELPAVGLSPAIGFHPGRKLSLRIHPTFASAAFGTWGYRFSALSIRAGCGCQSECRSTATRMQRADALARLAKSRVPGPGRDRSVCPPPLRRRGRVTPPNQAGTLVDVDHGPHGPRSTDTRFARCRPVKAGQHRAAQLSIIEKVRRRVPSHPDSGHHSPHCRRRRPHPRPCPCRCPHWHRHCGWDQDRNRGWS